MDGRRLSGLGAIVLLLGACGQVVGPTATAVPNVASAVPSDPGPS